MSSLRLRTGGAALGLWLLAACGGGGGDGPVVEPPVPTVRGVSVTPAAATLRVGETQTLTALVDAINGAGTSVTWSSESPTLATVSTTGVVTAVATGTAVIRATSVADARQSGTATITVQPARNILIDPGTASVGTGQTVRLTATVQIDPGLPTTVTWRSVATSIATVSSSGVVTGVAQGTTQIQAISTADTTLRGTAVVNVVPVVRSVAVSPTSASVFIGDTRQLAATVSADAGVAQTVTWRTSNPAIATVNATGLVTAVALGNATITVLSTVDTTRRATATITVPARPITVSIAQRNVSVNPTTSVALTGTVSADPGVNTALSWTSSAPSIASVSATGVVTGVSAGKTLITAAAVADGSKWDTVTVNVVPRLANRWTSARLSGVLYDDVVAVAPFDANNAFVVNVTGDILRWNGATWAVSARGSTYNTMFYALHGVGTTNLLAVGANGVIVRWNGTAWSAMTSGTTRALYSVWMENASSAWAVGSGGTVLRWNGTAWSTESAGSTSVLNGVWAGDGVVYAVGADGEVLRRSGTTWSRVTVPTGETLYGVHGLNVANVVIVGAQGTILRWNGTIWSTLPSAGLSGGFYAITGSAANDGRRYIVGDDGMARVDVNAVTVERTPYAPRLYSVGMDASGAVWTTGQRGVVMRSGASWTTLNLAPDLLDVWTTAADNAWVVGEFGSIYRWNGTTWTRQTTPTTVTLDAVWAPGASDAFAGGENGTMLRWNGSTWSAMTFPGTGAVYALWGTSSSNVYAATSTGEVLKFNGVTWSVSTTTPNPLWATYGYAANDLFATGENGAVWRLSGTTWSALPSPVNGTLAGLWTTGPTGLYVVGANASGSAGVAYSWNGTAWSAMNVGSTRLLTSIWGPSLLDLYVTGDAGTLLHYDGASWQSMTTGTSDLLWSVSGAPNAVGGAFAVGYNGTIVAGSLSSTALRAAITDGVGGIDARARLEPAPGAMVRRGPLPAGEKRARRRL